MTLLSAARISGNVNILWFTKNFIIKGKACSQTNIHFCLRNINESTVYYLNKYLFCCRYLGCLPAQNFSSSQMAKPSRRCFILMSVRRIVLFWWKRLPEHTGAGTAVHTPSCPLRTERRRELLRRQCHRTAGPWQRPETEITPCRCPHLVQSPN